MSEHLVKYQSICENLRSAFQSGKYAVGEKLPPERELAQSYNVSLLTLRKALGMLEQDGMINKVHGQGNFVQRMGPENGSDEPMAGRCVALVFAEGPQENYMYPISQRHNDAQYRSYDRRLREYGYSLLLAHITAAEVDRTLPPALKSGAVAGIILDGVVEDVHVAHFQKLGVPLVVFGNRPVTIPVPTVRYDYEEFAYLVTRAYIEAGKGPVYLITSPFDLYYCHEIMAGYKRAVQDSGDVVRIRIFSEGGNCMTEFRDQFTWSENNLAGCGELPCASNRFHAELREMFNGVEGDFAVLSELAVPITISRFYSERGWTAGDHPLTVMIDTTYSDAGILDGMSTCVMDFGYAAGIAVDVLERMISGGRPVSVLMVPVVEPYEENGELRLSIKWQKKEVDRL